MKHLKWNFKVPKADKFESVSIRDHSKQNIESLHYYLKEFGFNPSKELLKNIITKRKMYRKNFNEKSQ